jgi:hypothetical protein
MKIIQLPCWHLGPVAVLRIRSTLMWIRILPFTLMRIQILPFTLMRIRILPFNLMRIRILLFNLMRIRILPIQKDPLRLPPFTLMRTRIRILLSSVADPDPGSKNGMTTNFFFTPLFCCCFWIRDPGWVNIRIRDKHPGSATLLLSPVTFPDPASQNYADPCGSGYGSASATQAS